MNMLLVVSLGLLVARYEAQPGDPPYMVADLEKAQEYYAQAPGAQELLDSLADLKWTLEYKKDTLATRMVGTRLTLTRAVVQFDPRTGARFIGRGRQVVSPAQALVHELLHVKTALENPKTFLSQSLPGIYPIMHERSVIRAEQRLFQRMGVFAYRSRDNHKGQLLPVDCVTCVP